MKLEGTIQVAPASSRFFKQKMPVANTIIQAAWVNYWLFGGVASLVIDFIIFFLSVLLLLFKVIINVFVWMYEQIFAKPVRIFLGIVAVAVAILFIVMMIQTGYWEVIYTTLKILTEKGFDYAISK